MLQVACFVSTTRVAFMLQAEMLTRVESARAAYVESANGPVSLFLFISHTQFELLADFIERINTNNWGNLGVSPWKDMVFSPFVIEPWHYCQPCLCTQPIYCKRSPMWRLCRHMHTHYTLWVQ